MSTGLYTQPQFPPTPPSQPQFAAPPRRSSGNLLMSLLLIGGGFLVLLSMLFVAGVWYVMSNLEGFVVNLGREGVVGIVNQSQIPAQEKDEVIVQVDRVVAAYKAGEIDQDELDELFMNLEDTPVLAYVSFFGMEEHYLADTTLPPAEQDDLRLACRRVLYGLTAGQIEPEEFYETLPDDYDYEQALAHSPEQANDIVRKWTRELTTLCDESGVINNPPAVDVGDEMKKLVDGVLAK